jgi:anti-sigma factor ChrR (cupin superfamily)
MFINADFSRRVVIAADEYHWTPSPQGGVERMMLDRLGAEKARATSVVRYSPGSNFPPHRHPGGEEILVLSGVFSDDDGDYPAGWYLRNPPGSSHRPFSDEGAVIFVKLWQMTSHDTQSVRIDTTSKSAWHRTALQDVCPLYSCATEHVCLQRLAPGAPLFNEPVNTAELLLLSGEMFIDGKAYGCGSWMRFPANDWPQLAAGASGACVYLKTGHLTGVVSKV